MLLPRLLLWDFAIALHQSVEVRLGFGVLVWRFSLGCSFLLFFLLLINSFSFFRFFRDCCLVLGFWCRECCRLFLFDAVGWLFTFNELLNLLLQL